MSSGVRCRSTNGVFHRSQLGVFGCPRIWELTDEGFVYGGQDGGYRAYYASRVGVPNAVAESPWCILRNRPSLRLDWENDDNCEASHIDGRGNNYYEQVATAKTTLVLPAPARLVLAISGMAETEDPQEPDFTVYERMEINVDDALVATGHSPGGGLGCDGGMAAVVTAPASGVSTDEEGRPYVDLSAGAHSIYIWASTIDEWYHWRGSERLANDGAYYQFDMQLIPIPE